MGMLMNAIVTVIRKRTFDKLNFTPQHTDEMAVDP